MTKGDLKDFIRSVEGYMDEIEIEVCIDEHQRLAPNRWRYIGSEGNTPVKLELVCYNPENLTTL